MSYDVNAYYMSKLKAVMDDNAEKENYILELETYVFELCDRDCPDEYRDVVKGVLWQNGKD